MGNIIPILRETRLGVELEKLRKMRDEGKTKEEILNIIDRRILEDEDVEKIFNEVKKEMTEKKQDEVQNEIQEMEEPLTIEETEKIIQEEEKKSSYQQNSAENVETKQAEEIIDLSDDELVDFPSQPFKLYNEEQKKDMIQSIRINGIIQPLIVRPIENGKYQILAGHNRRACGREAGLKTFPCRVKYGLTDEEAELYLVDTNLATREKISPMEKAKALLIRKNAYKHERIRLKIEQGIIKDNMDQTDIREKIKNVENMSDGNLQRYLRLNYLEESLQNLVDEGKINIKVGEKLSFIGKGSQRVIANMVEKNNIKVSESQAKKLKEEENLNKEKIEELLIKKQNEEEKALTIKFKIEEIAEFFETRDIEIIKSAILEALRIQKENSDLN